MLHDSRVTYPRFRRLNCFAGWSIFFVALLTYWLTLEPTVSFWDCPEYVTVADKMQIGHSPGNPMWMLAARFFINFAPDVSYKALLVNAMSGLFTAFAVMILYRTIVLLLLYGRYDSSRSLRKENGLSLPYLITLIGSGAVGALAFCWSDSMWYSAVEAEVYAFSIFLTALTIYVVLHWSFSCYGKPHADRWLILAAYLIGVGICVHELNLLCLPAVSLIVWFRVGHKRKSRFSWLALLIGCISVVVIQFLFIPGFLGFAKAMELWMVNRMYLPFNSGLIAAWIILFTVLLAGALCFTLPSRRNKYFRVLGLLFWSVLMFFIGLSCYALIIIRGAANPPLNTGNPENVFNFASYYAREQYGSAPLIRGYAFGAPRLRVESTDERGNKSYHKFYNVSPQPRYLAGKTGDKVLLRSGYATSADSMQAAADSRRTGDFYIMTDYEVTPVKSPEMMMWFPRMYSDNPDDIEGYFSWGAMTRDEMVAIPSPTVVVDRHGNPVSKPAFPSDTIYRPTYLQNLTYLAGYQIGFMYWRYFLWNFVGRQNDLPGHGEPDAGLPVTGIRAIDRFWTDTEGNMPTEASTRNPGRNVYWFLPLVLGLAGLVWQVRKPGRNRRAAAVTAALFFFTGMAIVLYLNQPPVQARDRDYAFLGSYFSFCIWIGVGIMPLRALLCKVFRKSNPLTISWVSVILAAIVPLQMLSQTFDDHDRSGRTATPDMAHNILAPLPKNAILFMSGDNSSFPLWYMQGTEEERRDVRLISLTYLLEPDYVAALLHPVWNAPALSLQVPENHLRMGRYSYAALPSDSSWMDAYKMLTRFYESQSASPFPRLGSSRVFIPFGNDTLRINLRPLAQNGIVHQNLIILLDIISSAAAENSAPPLYWIESDGDGIFQGQLLGQMLHEGPVMRLSPGNIFSSDEKIVDDALIHYRWGGADNSNYPYFDPLTASRVTAFRSSLINHAVNLSKNPSKRQKALQLIELIRKKMPEKALPYHSRLLPDSTYFDEGTQLALALWQAADASGNRTALRKEALELLRRRVDHTEGWLHYRDALPTEWQKYITPLYRDHAGAYESNLHLLDSLSSLPLDR